jgi:hypothetical protein
MEGSASDTTWVVGLVAAIFVGWIVLFGSLWTGIVYFMARFGGWKRLAERYAANAPPVGGTVMRGATGMVGFTNYKRVLTIIVIRDGLYIETSRIFRMFHPPIFIPWHEIHNAAPVTFVFRQYVAFDIGAPKIASMRLPLPVFAESPIKV